MSKWMIILFAFLMGVAVSSCSFTVQDTPELRAKFANSLPVPELPTVTPEACLDILGNVSASGELIYHLPGQANYNNVKPEAYFCSEGDAQAAGYRKSQR